MAKAPPQLSPQQMADLSAMFYELTHDPKTRPYVAKLVEHKFPDRAQSFADVKTHDRISNLERKIEQDKQLQAAADLKRARDSQRDALKARYDDKALAEIDKVVARYGNVVSYNEAAILYAAENPPIVDREGPPANERMGATWEFPTVAGKDGKLIPFADFVKNPSAAARDAAYSVITEFNRRGRMSA